MKRPISILAAISLVAILNVSCGEETPVKVKPAVAADAYVEPTPAANSDDFLNATATPDPAATADTGGGMGDMFNMESILGMFSGLGGGATGTDTGTDTTTDPNAGPVKNFFAKIFGGMGG